MRFSTEIALAAAAGANTNGAAIDCSQVFALSLMVVTTSTLAGTAKLQFSNDPFTPGHAPTNWLDITSASVTPSSAGVLGLMKLDACYNWVRVVWTKSGGSGAITCYLRSNAF